jgi:short-subunit dehydrogenase
MAEGLRPLGVVTGASSGIGFELAKESAQKGFDLVIAADEPAIHAAAQQLQHNGAAVEAVEADLATMDGVDRLCDAVKAQNRPVEVLMANAGRGLGHAFLDQDFAAARRVVDTNITGTLYLLHRLGREMREQGFGRILITGSIAGFMPGSFQAVYNGSKAFLDSFSYALRNELQDSGITVTCLMPGATQTAFFERAGMLDTRIGTEEKDDPAEVAKEGFEAMMRGEGGVIVGLKNKAQVAVSRLLSSERMAERHRGMAAPGTAEEQTAKTAEQRERAG